MLTNGFALFRGAGAPSLVQDAAQRVKRYAREVLVCTGGEFEELGAERLSGDEVALAFSLERGGFPLVHGYIGEGQSRGGALPDGEFSLLGRGEDGRFYGERDPIGTRGLWAVPRGRGAGSIASDYRLLGVKAGLLPPGTIYEKGRTMRRARRGAKREDVRPASSFEEASTGLASLLEDSVRRRVQGQGRVAVSFSGGLDSSLLALLASRHAEVVLCSAYAPGSRDEGQSEKAAGLLGLRLETALLDEDTVARRSMEAEMPPGDTTDMDKALWCIYSTTSGLAKRSGARMIILGQLADELFGGYMKYAIRAREEGAEAAEEMMREDVRACADRGFLRDEAACSASCEVRFPYADEGVASFAARLPLDYKIRDGERKAVLRAAALELGLPGELAAAPKKAAQFSSGAAKLLKRRW
jgi:asparagine synthase (glutamine-hydrolysing)